MKEEREEGVHRSACAIRSFINVRLSEPFFLSFFLSFLPFFSFSFSLSFGLSQSVVCNVSFLCCSSGDEAVGSVNGGESSDSVTSPSAAEQEPSPSCSPPSNPHSASQLAILQRQREEEEQRRQIQDALNKQTFAQFKAYAEQQFPGNPDQQAVLIRQLQEQHYYQYMQQIYQQQMETHANATLAQHGANDDLHQQQQQQQQQEAETVVDAIDKIDLADERHVEDDEEDEDEVEHECDQEDCEYCAEQLDESVETASMWTKKELGEFKDSVRRESGGDSIIKVGHGETVTVRVPTHEDGNALFWEFATDSYDIAFGVFFEWNRPEDENEVSVHISDSEDEDLEDEYGDGEGQAENGDPESGSRTALMQ